MSNEILPAGTNIIITKKIPQFGTMELGWPYSIITGNPLEIGMYGFIIRNRSAEDIIRNGYLVKLEDEGVYYLPPESLDVVDENIHFFKIFKSYGSFSIRNSKSMQTLRDADNNELLFNSQKEAEEYLLEKFEVVAYGQ